MLNHQQLYIILFLKYNYQIENSNYIKFTYLNNKFVNIFISNKLFNDFSNSLSKNFYNFTVIIK